MKKHTYIAIHASLFVLIMTGFMTRGLFFPKKIEANFARLTQKHENWVSINEKNQHEQFNESQYHQDFWRLSKYYLTRYQEPYIPTFSGVASCMMILNALEIANNQLTGDEVLGASFTHIDHFFSPKVQKILTKRKVERSGMTLNQLAKTIASYDLKVQVFKAESIAKQTFREQLIKTMENPNEYMIVNYLREFSNGDTKNHFSPVAAYNQARDHVLIMDVSQNQFTPHWESIDSLYAKMKKIEMGKKRGRGFSVISKP